MFRYSWDVQRWCSWDSDGFPRISRELAVELVDSPSSLSVPAFERSFPCKTVRVIRLKEDITETDCEYRLATIPDRAWELHSFHDTQRRSKEAFWVVFVVDDVRVAYWTNRAKEDVGACMRIFDVAIKGAVIVLVQHWPKAMVKTNQKNCIFV